VGLQRLRLPHLVARVVRWLTRALLRWRRPIGATTIPLSEARFDPEVEEVFGSFAEHRKEEEK
jgi:hypothetical protein